MFDQNFKMSYTNMSNVTNITTAATITSSTDSGKAILKKMSVGGNISDKKVNRKEGNFYFF